MLILSFVDRARLATAQPSRDAVVRDVPIEHRIGETLSCCPSGVQAAFFHLSWTVFLHHYRTIYIQFCRGLRIPESFAEQVPHADLLPMFHFYFTQVMQAGHPLASLTEKFGSGAGHQDVSRIPAVHHALGNIDPASGYVAVEIDVCDTIDRSGVNAHA